MILEKYGISFKRITADDIEFIRQKRNSKSIREKMIFRKHISSIEQKEWFESIDNLNNLYYLLIYEDTKIGLANSKNIDWNLKTCEGGLFIWDKKYINSAIPFVASLAIFDLSFDFLKWKKSYVKVLRNNKNAIGFNKSLGFEVSDDDDANLPYVTLNLTEENFEKKCRKLIDVSDKIYKNQSNLILKFEPHDFSNGIYELIQPFIDKKGKQIVTEKQGDIIFNMYLKKTIK